MADQYMISMMTTVPAEHWGWAEDLDRHAQSTSTRAGVVVLGARTRDTSELVGWALYSLSDRVSMEVGVIAVAPSHRQRGVCTAMLTKMLASAKEATVHTVSVVAENKHLVPMLRRFGFTTADGRKYVQYLCDRRASRSRGKRRAIAAPAAPTAPAAKRVKSAKEPAEKEAEPTTEEWLQSALAKLVEELAEKGATDPHSAGAQVAAASHAMLMGLPPLPKTPSQWPLIEAATSHGAPNVD